MPVSKLAFLSTLAIVKVLFHTVRPILICEYPLLNHPVFHTPGSQLEGILGPRFADHLATVGVHGVFRQREPAGDLLARQTVGQKADDLCFALGGGKFRIKEHGIFLMVAFCGAPKILCNFGFWNTTFVVGGEKSPP